MQEISRDASVLTNGHLLSMQQTVMCQVHATDPRLWNDGLLPSRQSRRMATPHVTCHVVLDWYQYLRGTAVCVSRVEEYKLTLYHIPEDSNQENYCQYLQSL
jgi:hypothetical protein